MVEQVYSVGGATLGIMATHADRGRETGREIRLVEHPDGQWTARDLGAEVSADGKTHVQALAALEKVVAALEDEDDDAVSGESRRLGDALAEYAIESDLDPVAAIRELREDI